MKIKNGVLSNGEKIIFALRGLYAEYGYKPYKMSKFEEYDLYAGNKDFLVSEDVITFTDTNGKLMALKPDVTLSIIKNCKDGAGVTKVYYSENVYRVVKGTGSFGEIMQTGLECFGDLTESEITDVITLSALSLKTLSARSVLDISDVGIVGGAIDSLNLAAELKAALFKAVAEKNAHGISEICAAVGSDGKISEMLTDLIRVSGNIPSALGVLRGISEKYAEKELFSGFISALEKLALSEFADMIRVDFSVTGDVNYYNGIVFKGFVNGVPSAVLSGGQYDNLMRKMRKKSKAIGFAVYTDALDRIDLSDTGKDGGNGDGFINIALPKGRLGENVYEMFAKAGYECPAVMERSRKLIFENAEKKVRYFWVKPSDVPIYVERGAADIGVAGKDILLEYEPDVYELLDLKIGKCKMAIAAPEGFCEDESKTLRVATKFPRIARDFYMKKGRDIDIIRLNGSIEIAPILGLSDVIADIVETGATLKENALSVTEIITPISARLIANKSATKFKDKAIDNAVASLAETIGDQ